MNGLEQDRRLLEALCEWAGVAPSRLGEEAGLSSTTVSRPMSGMATTRLSATTLDKLRARFPDFPGWLQNSTNDRRLPFRGAEPERADTVELEEFDLAYGMGSVFIHEAPIKSNRQTFSRAWLRYFTDAPFDRLFFARGIGDSMTPTILDNDVILIDTSQQTPRMWDQLWAIDMGGMGMIKRLRPGRDGGIRLISDNPAVKEDTAYDGEMNVIGRVVAIVRKT